jgi:hypothetical protein
MNKENELFNLPEPICKAHQNKKVSYIVNSLGQIQDSWCTSH